MEELMSTITRRIAALAAFLGLVCLGSPASAEQVTLLSVPTGHSIILNAWGLTRVATGDGKIAGVIPVGTSQVIVNGKNPGRTTIVVWSGGHRTTYDVTVTYQYLDDIAQMLRTAIQIKGVQVVTFGDNIVVRGTVADGAQFQQVSDIVTRFVPLVEKQLPGKTIIINGVTVTQNMGNIQQELARVPGSHDIRVDPDGKGNVIVSGNVNDAVTAQAILDRARGLAGPYLASNGQLIDRLSALNNSQIDVKVYILEVDKTAQSNLGMQLQGAAINPTQPGTYTLVPPAFPFVEATTPVGGAFTVQPFYRTTTLAPTLNLLMNEGHARILSSPDLVTTPGNKATFLVGGQIPVVTSTGLGQVNVTYQNYGVQLNVTPTILGNGSIEAVVAPTVSALDYSDAVIVSGFVIPALTVSQLSTDVVTRPGESILLGGLVKRLQQKTITKIPLLSDIPILGKLFTDTAYQSSQADVVFVMTPEIVSR
jgi:Flp pilus assembly secretin CpaC